MSRIITKVLYGSVAILRGYCKKCQGTAFIVDRRYRCCDALVDEIPEKEKIKRETEGEKERSYIPLKIRKEILVKQENRCIYCEQKLDENWWNKRESKYTKLKTHFDHFISWNYSRNNAGKNLYASCHICNGIKSDHYFQDLISAREYINEKRKEKGY